MADLSLEEAREYVDYIRVNNGGIEESDRERTPQAVLQALDSVRKQLASSTELLATELYTKSTRFVFELIQNAEDNSYTVARAAGSNPFLSFSIHHDKIVIDSNEDGFSKANVHAICKVRTSTKTGVRGYIGEKGIGFKSVFTVASKVHVQSGPFAFYFKYAGEDDGMGMVTPFNGVREHLPSAVRTRFILTLKNPSEFSDLVNEFMDLPDTLLLFLTTLKKLQISVKYRFGGDLEKNYEYRYEKSTGKGSLIKDSSKEGLKGFHFFVRRKTVRNLPTERARKDIKDAEVVLAFPVDSSDIPVIEQQHVCAFLPLRKIGFPFQIQSDFITQASREDVLHSEWNKALLVGAAEVFVEAVIAFCDHPLLQYSWPRYLPTGVILDPFWEQLKDLITSGLGPKPILRSWSSNKLECIKQLKYVIPSCLDTDGEPLFSDLEDEVYLSNNYAPDDVSTLRKIGLQNISVAEIWKRVRKDLRSSASKMKGPETSADWHSRCSEMILTEARRHDHFKIVQAFAMFPLQDGSWTSLATGPVYYHEVAGVDIPLDLGLRLLAPEAARHFGRRELFDAVGVKHCDPKDIRKLIVAKYAKWNNVDLESSVSHLRFLFHHHAESEQPIDKTMFIFDADRKPVYRTFVALGQAGLIVDDIYFNTPGAYNVAALRLGQPDSDPYNIHLIHPAYMEDKEAVSRLHDLRWHEWLQTYAGVLHSPRLVDSRDPEKLSNLFTWILKWRREYILGILRTHWQTYSDSITPNITSAIGQVKLKCTNMHESALEDTFLPLPDLLNVAANLGVKDSMQFLNLPVDFDKEQPAFWSFLDIFGVGIKTDLYFYLEALRATRCISANFSQQRLTLLQIYAAIEERAKVDDSEYILDHFKNEKGIHVRNNDESSTLAYPWVPPTRCVWKGPNYLTTHFVLAEDDDYKSHDRCNRLFRSVLKIPDADWSYTLAQIAHEKSNIGPNERTDPEAHLSRMYHDLFSDVEESADWKRIGNQFEREGLIYVQPNEWHSPSECIWSDNTYIPGKFPLARQYPKLKGFFVGRLGVQSPTLVSQIQELSALCSKQTASANFKQIIALMKEINFLKPDQQAVQSIQDTRIIPVKDEQGHGVLRRPTETFVIVDLEKEGAIFAGKVAIFAVPLGELHSVRTLLSALGLDGRYMSHMIREITKADNAVEDTAMTRSFRQRAFALMRCARHFESPQAERSDNELLRKLRRAKVYQSNEVVRTVNLELNGQVIARQTTSGKLHLENGESCLKVYVPTDSTAREICCHKQLPEQLVTHWSIAEKAVPVIQSVLIMSIAALDEMLSDHGIPELPDLQQLLDIEPDDEEEYLETAAGNQAPEFTHARTYSMSTGPTDSTRYFARSTSASYFTQSRATTPMGEMNDHVTEYRKLLGKVIDASGRSSFPSQWSFQAATSSTPAGIDVDTIFGVRSQDALAHDIKIGAAGELFAFEMLHRYTDQSCCIEHWKSKIRDRVRVHEKYHDLAPWRGNETADIVYTDQASSLTGRLIAHGYLDWHWAGKNPTYYLEVKTTTGSCDTRFFMSKAQVKRMRAMRLDPAKVGQDIYVILRVYNLASDNIGMRLLVDPATLEQEKQLTIEADTFTVLQKEAPATTVGGRSLSVAPVIPARFGNETDNVESPI